MLQLTDIELNLIKFQPHIMHVCPIGIRQE